MSSFDILTIVYKLKKWANELVVYAEMLLFSLMLYFTETLYTFPIYSSCSDIIITFL